MAEPQHARPPERARRLGFETAGRSECALGCVEDLDHGHRTIGATREAFDEHIVHRNQVGDNALHRPTEHHRRRPGIIVERLEIGLEGIAHLDEEAGRRAALCDRHARVTHDTNRPFTQWVEFHSHR